MKKLLKNKNALFLWISRTTSRFGDSLESLALMYLVYEITNSALAMSTVMIFSMIPNLLVSPIAGAIVDKYNKKTILFISEIVRTVTILMIPILSWFNVIQFWHINLIAVIVSIAESFYEPCYGVTVALAVEKEELPVFNSVVTLSNNIARCLGYSLSGFIMIYLGKNILFVFDSFTFLLSAIFALLLKFNEVIENKKVDVKKIGSDILSGMKYLYNKKLIIGFVLIFLSINLFSVPLTEFMPILLKDVFNLNKSWSGILMTVISIGTVAGSILYPIIYKFNVKLKNIVFFSFASIGSIILINSFFHNIFIIILLYSVFGVLVSILNMWVSTGIQQNCDISYLGRVSSIISIFGTATIPLACATFGLVIDKLGMLSIFITISICFLALSVFLSIYLEYAGKHKIKSRNLNKSS